MSILVEKRHEYEAEVARLVEARAAEIDAKVAEFKAQLLAEPIDGLNDLQCVIEALNQVIAYEDEHLPAPAAPTALEQEGAPAAEETPVEALAAEEKVEEAPSTTTQRIINLFHKA